MNVRRSLGKRISSTINRTSQPHLPHLPHFHHHNHHSGQISHNDELLIIRRKLNNLKREKKAFRTLGLILSALLICWLPFFVTLPTMGILKDHRVIKDENTGNTWFKITFWLGYCNSAVSFSMLSKLITFLFDFLVKSICIRIFEPCHSTSIPSNYFSTFLLLVWLSLLAMSILLSN